MKHSRDLPALPDATARPAPTRARAKGRHTASHAARRRRTGPTWSSLAPTSWPLSIGLGLAVTMATTTGMAVASGTTELPRATSPEAAPSGVRAPGDAAADLAAVTSAAKQAALLADRGQAASRNADRAAPTTSRAAGGSVGGTVVPADATMSAEKVALSVEAAPEPPPPPLPGCDGYASGTGSNGYIPESEMCTLWDGTTRIRADAGVALARLNLAYRVVFGENMCITDGYRSYSSQVATKEAKGYLAATPGTSNHGWGLAVDLCPETYSGSRYDWLRANAPAYGWDNPDWAIYDKYEPWHWEYTDAVTEMGG
ncbi:M15 family metallopeptidase [Isoptericola sediminis]|uniref:D-alanyl-D-alanine carboxypeptidase-like core domain-containing protein n=1 Tax=Isoptericola sediminis TaxID=2733572 RepID=A0A849JWX3_9MICO|nr:M15 family metallopeptidase [Isoptericola sediminis]NNU27094.1 hypothetical protein [Isoptericola sediminis]